MIKHPPIYQRESFLFFCAGIFSVLLSVLISAREAVINPDAICYLLSAKEVGLSGISAAMQLCGQAQWPFYSILIHAFAKVSHLSNLISAYFLNGFFSLVSVFSFILIVKTLGGSRRTLWLAALTILLSHEFNSVREYIIRDHGFWAFYLASLFFLLCFFQEQTWRNAFAWNMSLVIATLFRVEGAVFLLLIPFLTFFFLQHCFSKRLQFFFMLNLLTIIFCLATAIWLLTHNQTIDKFSRVAEVTDHLLHGFSIMYAHFQNTKVALMHTNVLIFHSTNELTLILILFILQWYFVSVMGNLSWVYSVLVLFAWRKRSVQFKASALLVLVGYIFINVLITSGFLLERLFLSKRYLIALSLILMLWVPFALDELLQKKTDWRYRMGFSAAIFFIFIASLGGIFNFGYSKAYIHDAGVWLAKNVPSNASLYVNDYQLMYYSAHFDKKIFENLHDWIHLDLLAQEEWRHYDYIALRLDKKNAVKMTRALEEKQLIPMQVFKNKRDDQIVIFRR